MKNICTSHISLSQPLLIVSCCRTFFVFTPWGRWNPLDIISWTHIIVATGWINHFVYLYRLYIYTHISTSPRINECHFFKSTRTQKEKTYLHMCIYIYRHYIDHNSSPNYFFPGKKSSVFNNHHPLETSLQWKPWGDDWGHQLLYQVGKTGGFVNLRLALGEHMMCVRNIYYGEKMMFFIWMIYLKYDLMI